MCAAFAPGTAVAVRGLFRGRVWVAHGATVVSDSPERSILALVPGSSCQVPALWAAAQRGDRTPRNHWDELATSSWKVVPWTWRWTRLLMVLEPGAYYAVNQYWSDAEERFLCWYVNFQLPFVRTPLGFDTLDLSLDLVVGPDLRLGWKDVAEYDEGVERGVIEPAVAQAVEAARSEVVARIDARRPPFDAPPASWPRCDFDLVVRELPEGWNVVA